MTTITIDEVSALLDQHEGVTGILVGSAVWSRLLIEAEEESGQCVDDPCMFDDVPIHTSRYRDPDDICFIIDGDTIKVN